MSQAHSLESITRLTESIARVAALPPALDEAALKRDYVDRGLAAEDDTFCLVRVIGNDLPPRHRVGQARENVRFTLENEAELPGCTKHWIVNRIVLPEEEEALVRLLESFGATYDVIAFDPEAYGRIGWDFESFDEPVVSDPDLLRQLGDERAAAAIDQLYRHKNCYVMNNNGARNVALAAGQAWAKWALPWDGNCFVTPSAWREIVEGVKQSPHLPYFIVPMARILDNAALLADDFVPSASEEPQIVFRRDAVDRFNERYRYGRRPKVEFLWRIGVPGEWDSWENYAWDAPFPPPSPMAGQFETVGWVARLFSGAGHLEAADKDGARSRAVARNTAIGTFLDALDTRLLAERTDPDALIVLDETVLARQAAASDAETARLKSALIAEVDAIVASRPPASDASGMSVATRLFLIALGLRLSDPDGPGRSERANAAGAALRDALGAESDGRSIPPGLLVEGEVWYLVEAVRILRQAQGLSDEALGRFRQALVRWLKAADGSAPEGGRDRHAARLLDRLVAAHFLGQWSDVVAAMRDLGERLFHGDFPFAIADDEPDVTDEDAARLQHWANAARVCDRLGLDLWNARCVSGRGLEHAFDAVLSTTWADTAATAHPLRTSVRENYGSGDHPAAARCQGDRAAQLLTSASGVRPYWALG